jgi:hypothetical protein
MGACLALALLALFAGAPSQAGAATTTVVTGTIPPNGATGVPVDSSLTVTFNQPVSVTGAWAEMFCTKSGSHALAFSGGPQTWGLAPQGDRATSESCAVTIKASNVSDMVTNFTFTFVTADVLPDAPPSVTGTTPADGATHVPVNSNLAIVFSEPIGLSSGITITCSASGAHAFSVDTSGATAVLDPVTDFNFGETCTVTIPATAVFDLDTNDPPEHMAADFSWSFTTVAPPNIPPIANAGGPYDVNEGDSITVTATASDLEGGPLTYAWDLDNNGTFGTPGQTVTFSAANLDGPSTRTIHVRVTDEGGLSDVADATVTIHNVAPTATFNAPASAPAGFAFTVSLSSPHDPSAADTAAGFTYAFDCGSGYGAFASASSASCPTTDTGTRSVGGKIRDKDGGVTEYRATVQVFVTFASLCDLVRSFATEPKVADDLCDKLAKAEGAPNANARAGLLGAFRNQVDAKTGKGLTSGQASLLKLLSTRL